MRMIDIRCLALFMLLTTTLPTPWSCAQSTSARSPGLIATIRTSNTSGSAAATETAPQRIDLHLQHKWTSPNQFDERIAPDVAGLTVRWSGLLDVKAQGKHQLSLSAQGRVSLKLDGREIIQDSSTSVRWFDSQVIDLPFGQHPIEIVYETVPRDGDHSGFIGVYWQGPGFEWEPISERYLSHTSGEETNDLFERGRMLAHALRCAACHDVANYQDASPAASLTRLDGNLQPEWLVSWLTAAPSVTADSNLSAEERMLKDDELARRMPHLGLSVADATDIATALYTHSLKTESKNESPTSEKKSSEKSASDKATKDKNSKDKPKRTTPSAAEGAIVFRTRGCIACHDLKNKGIGSRDTDDDATYLATNRWQFFMHQLFQGGDLGEVASKRSAESLLRWLRDPASMNANHRMPLPDLNALEQQDVALYLATLGDSSKKAEQGNQKTSNKGDAQRGAKLIAEHRCAACHQVPKALEYKAPNRLALKAESRWDAGCLNLPDAKRKLPGFALTGKQQLALKAYFTQRRSHATEARPTPADIRLVEHNCLACHSRGAAQGIGPTATALVSIERDLAARLPALLPPSLNGVGDKLHDHALKDAIERRGEPRRPWLEIRMPKYQMPAAEVNGLIDYLIASDRIPEREATAKTDGNKPEEDVVTRAAAGRLVTSEGFGCQSCHQIGKQPPPTVALNARGTDLTMLGDRVRHTWFDRWVRNPVRIVPRMEMPAIQLPVHGVLDNDLNRQIDAVWEMLNTKGFEPPSPAPVRVVRGHNQPGVAEPANVLTDVLETKAQNFLRPLIVGFDNRHNLLFDLERGRVSRWWIGDTARELTRGKSWYWELGGQPIATELDSFVAISAIDSAGNRWTATPLEQFAVELDSLEHTARGIVWRGRLHLARADDKRTVALQMQLDPIAANSTATSAANSRASGFSVRLQVSLPTGWQLCLDVPQSDSKPTLFQADLRSQIVFDSPNGTLVADTRADTDQGTKTATTRSLLCKPKVGSDCIVECAFTTTWPVDQVALATDAQLTKQPTPPATSSSASSASGGPLDNQPVEMKIVPGFRAVRLPLPRNEMPTALAWYKGQLAIGSLKGRVCLAIDTDGDGMVDQWKPISDDLPAPYGLAAHADGLDVLAKYGLVRLRPGDSQDVPWKMDVVADGWGYTADYHDWAVGLPRDRDGNYFVALPCQQDDRSPSAARLRGTIQKLIPQTPTSESPRAYRLETFAAGQRFPMGIAFNSQGQLFATDNQGNYNPFNELNHIQSGKRYGFINKLENKNGFNPPLESPAVNLPHPWTRSVNGICFLNTPDTAKSRDMYGPFEGHLVGCEYNELSLIRMSLEEVDGVMQGAAYLFSRKPEEGETKFEGPVVCSIAPDGDLYVGNIHDSGWGGGQNTGSIVRISPTGTWPLGIRTVTALKTGLAVEFTGKVDPQKAAKPMNYSLRSYRRVSTPAYGGNDQDEREENIIAARVLRNEARVELELNELRADCVYELRIGDIASDGTQLFPSEAHYTMKRVPKN